MQQPSLVYITYHLRRKHEYHCASQKNEDLPQPYGLGLMCSGVFNYSYPVPKIFITGYISGRVLESTGIASVCYTRERETSRGTWRQGAGRGIIGHMHGNEAERESSEHP
jgi:hypothetical protein